MGSRSIPSPPHDGAKSTTTQARRGRAHNHPAAPAVPVDPIERLSAEVGASSPEEVALYAEGATDHDLVAAGREVDTARITDDVVRVGTVAWAFVTTAREPLRAEVKLSASVVRALVWGAAQGHRAYRRLKSAKADRRRAKSEAAARVAKPTDCARGERDRLAESLRGVAAGDAAARAAIADALAPAAADGPEVGPGQALATLVGIGRGYVASDDANVRARCEAYGVTAAWLDECDGCAKEALDAERAGAMPAVASAELQTEVDRWDGVNLLLLERVVRAFAEGHKRDPAVPKLQLVSLRGALGGHPRRKKKPGAPPA